MRPNIASRVIGVWFQGLQNALSVHKVVLLFYYSRTVRIRSLQCFVLNGIIFLGSILFTRAVLLPVLRWMAVAFGADAASLAASGQAEHLWDVTGFVEWAANTLFQLFWFTPLYLISFILSAAWYQDIADKAFQHCSPHGAFTKVKHHRPAPAKSPKVIVAEELYRLFVVLILLGQASLLYYVPFVGPALSYVLCCFLYSFQMWEYRWSLEGHGLITRLTSLETHWLYFFGFGTPCTLLTFFYSKFVAAGVYALVFPVCIIMAVVSTPLRLRSKYVPAQLPVSRVARASVSAVLGLMGKREADTVGVGAPSDGGGGGGGGTAAAAGAR